MSTLKVNTINAATSGQAVAVDISNPKSFRNLIINGAMNIAQRGTSTSTNGGLCCDRFKCHFGGTDESPTFTQHALTSSDTGPWEKGFRNSLHITNGNQTGGADTNDEVDIYYMVEAQDLANSGWDYTSSSSYIMLSWWVRSSVAQNFHGYLVSQDGTSQGLAFETGSISANTWTKITKKIPGNSNLQFDNNNAEGLGINFGPFFGTNWTAANATLDAWAAWNANTTRRDNVSTWYTTNDATFEITGVQLEVGSYVTEFEHRTYAEELIRCKRYYQAAEGQHKWAWDGLYANGAGAGLSIYYALSPEMRAAASVTHNVDDKNNVSSSTIQTATDSVRIGATCSSSGRTAMTRSSSGYIRLDAEF